MNSDQFTQLLQKGLHITLGATASLLENLQDPQKRTENLSQLKAELDQLATDWVIKGESTEQEARNFVQQFLQQLANQQSNSATSTSSETSATTSAPPDVQLELQELTAQLAAIRSELEKLQNPNSEE